MGFIKDNLHEVRNRIQAAALKANRSPATIKLVAVSKTKSTQEVAEAISAGQLCFGENYAQELRDKCNELSADLKTRITSHESRVTSHEIEWHFIGHLQKNKAKIVAPIATWVESIDSLELAAALNKRATRPINCLIEVNLGDEETKTGAPISNIENIVSGFDDFSNLDLKGLMVIQPYHPDPEFGRPYFKKLRELLININESCTLKEPLKELSMGMSHDFEVAIEEGATIVRVGTAIFGERQKLEARD